MTLAVILAAGEARRAGGPKIVWPVEGIPSVRRVACAALGSPLVSEVVAVTGRWARETRQALAELPLRLVHNPDFAGGQSGSLAAALAQSGPAGEAMFLLADQPFITSQIIGDLIQFHRDSPGSITRPFLGGRALNPVLFDLGRWRGDLMAQTGDRGGRALVAENPAEVNLWPAEGYALRCFLDFDTMEEYENLAAIHE